MTPAELRAEQNRVTAPVAAATVAILRRMPVASLEPPQWLQLVALLFPAVQRARGDGVDLASEFYASQSPTGAAPDVAVPLYDASMLAKTLTAFVGPRIGDPDRHELAATMGGAAVARHVEQAGREWVALASSSDGVQYARVDPVGETCAFCQLLISRGPAYLSQASGAFRSHPACTCVAVPVFDPAGDWPGREQYEAAEELYAQATAGTSGKESLRAFRRAVEGDG